MFEALLYVASQCEPSVLLQSSNDDEDIAVHRVLSEDIVIAMPEYPDFSQTTRHLQIDESLAYAVINAVCFLLSGENRFDNVCGRWIALYRKNQITAYSSEEVSEDE